MEPGQEVSADTGQWRYYVVRGTASMGDGRTTTDVPMGQFAATDAGEAHSVANKTEQRVICIAVGTRG